MAIRKYKPTTPGRRGSSVADFAEITRSTPEKSLLRSAAEEGRPQRPRPDHHAAPGWRPQAAVPPDRLQAGRQGRRAGEGRAHRVRPEPHRAHRAAALRRRREALHPRAEGPEAGRPRSSPVRAPTSSRATTCRCATSRSVPPSTTWSCVRAAAPSWPARPASASSCSAVRARTRPCVCRPARSGGSTCAAARRVGEIGNADQSNINWGKAGRMRWKGKRPTVRGVAMNPVDHPHGGGEGKTSGGRHPVNPQGKPEGRTRRKGQPSDRLIVRRRYATRKRG